MGEWSEYFEDFPEENPANFVDGNYNPEGARRQREKKANLAKEQVALDNAIAQVIADAKKRVQSERNNTP